MTTPSPDSRPNSPRTAPSGHGSTEVHWGVHLGVWTTLFGVLFILRGFFLLIFLTFVFSYILSHTVDWLARYTPRRAIRVVGAASAFLVILVTIGLFIAPRVGEQAAAFSQNFPKYLSAMDRELIKLGADYPVIDSLVPGVSELRSGVNDWSLRTSPSARVLHDLIGNNDRSDMSESAKLKETVRTVADLGGRLLAIGSSFLLSLLFSFLIVLDLPRLTAAVRELAHTRIGVIYAAMAGSVYDFARTLGRALQAQLIVAILNTTLTAIALPFLGLTEKVAFLSMIVFLGSFVPVAGVFLSSIPICLITLQQSGFQLTFAAIGLITAIHLIETYILNPRIYGAHLHMNPVLVLIILTIGGKLFGIWGLVLGVPICRYIFGSAIRFRTNSELT